MMTKVPKVDEQDLKYVDKRAGWGTRTYLAPVSSQLSLTMKIDNGTF